MKMVRINNVSIPINQISALTMVPSCVIKNAEGVDVPQKAKIAVLVGMTNIAMDVDSDEQAKFFYEGVFKLLEENL